jgi:signal transduction histidine kinase
MKWIKNKLKMVHIFVIMMAAMEIAVAESISVLFYFMVFLKVDSITSFLIASSMTIFTSMTLGTYLSRNFMMRMLKPVFDINKASKDVINGNYAVRLSEDNYSVEINEITRNFNTMLRELSNTEILRNDFVSNVSHEFKTPLAAIEGYVTLLQEDLPEEERQDYIEKILNNTERLSKLTKNILALSRYNNQEFVQKKENFSLDEQLRQIIVNFSGRWEENNLDLDLQLEEVNFYGDKYLLYQVFSNLIDNAIKFSNENGILRVRCRRVDNQVVISVGDTGIGMDEDTKKHIFDKFYQGDSSRAVIGNGLGLALVKRIVDICGGTIEVESVIGKGTTFSIFLTDDN